MGKQTDISWTDHTFNPWWGCTRVSPGCVHCYAETFDKRVSGKDEAHWGVKAERRFFGDKHWNEPLKWNRDAEKAGVRKRVFCASMADVFEDRPELVEHRRRLFLLIQNTPWLDWLLLTKRPENIRRLASEAGWEGDDWPLNVWIGCTVESQEYAEERVRALVHAAPWHVVRFLSCEPLIGPVNLTKVYLDAMDEKHNINVLSYINWIICGGESGAGARPMHIDWARSLRDQSADYGVAFHFKQWGQHDANGVLHHNKHDTGRTLDGMIWDDSPPSLDGALIRDSGERSKATLTGWCGCGDKIGGFWLRLKGRCEICQWLKEKGY